MEHTEQITRQMVRICTQILTDSGHELYLNMRYLDLALSGLSFQITTDYPGVGTDGTVLFAHPHILADLYEKNRLLVNRVYLHCVLHCLLRHLFKRPGADPLLWRLSCDIAVESIIDGLHMRAVRTGISRLRQNTYDALRKEHKVLTAEGIFRALSKHRPRPFELHALQEEFCIDDHSLWPSAGDPDQMRPETELLQKRWQEISEKTQTEMETFASDASEGAGDTLTALQVENRQRYDYKAFLRKFALLHEEMRVDPDTFDYVFYTYGLSLYGNMPLIEPQEYREAKRIREFVIVIDVSMSTSGELVKSFLEQTYAVLTESESYLNKVNIRILQCDEEIREDVKITSREDLDRSMENLTLSGGGGTDFRPAFAYVRRLVEEKCFTDLRGMIYFTDGKGIYPARMPAWETAFVFMEEDVGQTLPQVPPWAIRLMLPKEQLEEESDRLRTDYHFI